MQYNTASPGNRLPTFRQNVVVSSSWIDLLGVMKVRSLRCLETSGTDNSVALRRIPEERKLQLHRCENLKTHF
jgi:hypothetical protein